MQRRSQESIIAELQRRTQTGLSLKSGDNRGDWLYASAVKHFGSWGAAVEAAGFDYDEVVWKPMSADDLITTIRELADAGDALVLGDHRELSAPAHRHFGTWEAAVEAAGRTIPDRRKWSPENVIKLILAEIEAGHSMGGGAVNKRNPNLYAAGRRRFGSWTAAVEAATTQKGASVTPTVNVRGQALRSGRPPAGTKRKTGVE